LENIEESIAIDRAEDENETRNLQKEVLIHKDTSNRSKVELQAKEETEQFDVIE
jgi:hypothetical protein